MRIVFEFYGKQPQGTASVTAYGRTKGATTAWPGSRCEIVVCDAPSSPTWKPEPDTLYIEGDTDAVRAALKEALTVLALAEEIEKDNNRKRTRRRRPSSKR